MRVSPAMATLGLCCFGACGAEVEERPIIGTTTCGVPEGKAATECASLADCGGPNNARKVEFCENCFARGDSHVCESGTCKALDTSGSIKSAISIPAEAAGALSYTIAALNPIMADGTRLSCEKLLASCTYRDDFAFNAANSTFKAFPAPANPSNAYPLQTPADVGVDRLLVIFVTEGSQGKGRVLASGCVGGIEVRAGETTTVPIDLAPM
ncbi:MAG: hypothetical protein HYV07_24225 [Deltaproteobacteria bacterium]|nr:hypothetical protein [Deltaproteobacteria bacterium]